MLFLPATNCRVSASTQNQALNALVFLYKRVLGRELEGIGEVERAESEAPAGGVEPGRGESTAVSGRRGAASGLSAPLRAQGLRLLEGLRLRVKDIDFGRNEITVRDGKGAKDRASMLPASCKGSC